MTLQETMQWATNRAKETAEFHIARSMSWLADRDKKTRLERLVCRTCFYINSGGMAGQAFTRWKCAACEKETMHPNTATPKLCDPCAKTLELCARCAADIHERLRRKLKCDK